jgi:hypothetical protein
MMSPTGDSDQEEGSWWEVLAASPFGDVALFAAICLVGGVSIVALRRIPIVVLTAGIAAVVLLVFAGNRLALRAGRKWTPRTYLKAAALASGALAVCVGLGYMLWVMLCDC